MKRATAIFREIEFPDRNLSDFKPFQPWFRAAAAYNVVWGLVTLLCPALFFQMTRMEAPNYPVLWQVVGMFVLVFAPGYWWASLNPFRFRHLILIGFLGKLFGATGYLWFSFAGALPGVFGWTILTNDLLWLPSFYLFLRRVARETGGWIPLAKGA
jgi:hypothetical protein